MAENQKGVVLPEIHEGAKDEHTPSNGFPWVQPLPVLASSPFLILVP